MDKVKFAILKKSIEGELYELLVKTSAQNVFMPDGTALSAYLANLVTGVSKEEMETAIETAIKAVIDGAPEAFDTLKELADWVQEHGEEYQQIVGALAGKVDKVEGKGLSTEDFTTALKTKLEGLENYQHPASHSADMITETDNRKFVTAAEKAKIAEAGRVFVGPTTPADLTDKDLFFEVVG